MKLKNRNNPLHVRILAGYLHRGAGANVYNVDLAKALADRGFHVSLLAFHTIPEVEKFAEVHVINMPNFHDTLLWRLSYLLNWLVMSWRLMKSDIDEPDIVIGAEHFFVWAHAKKFPQVPWIYLPHSYLLPSYLREISAKGLNAFVSELTGYKVQKWALLNANRVLRYTSAAAKALHRYYGIPDNQISYEISPPGVMLQPPITTRGSSDSVHLLFVGSLLELKQPKLCLDALRFSVASAEKNVFLEIVGDGPQRLFLEGYANELGVSERVRFHGHQEDPFPFYRQADIFLMPSRQENFGLVILEAMAHGLPVVALHPEFPGAVNANLEIIEHGKDGFLVKTEEDFSIATGKLAEEKLMRNEMSMAARRKIGDHFTQDRHIRDYERLISDLVLWER